MMFCNYLESHVVLPNDCNMGCYGAWILVSDLAGSMISPICVTKDL